MTAHLAALASEQQQLQALDAERAEVRARSFPPLEKALRTQSQIAEERQYLAKMIEQLGRANRSEKTSSQVAALREKQQEFLVAEGDEAFALAKSIAETRGRVETTAASAYAKPYTLPMQTVRSVLCVFVGFVIGTAIAVPIGVLCGLSKTAMAALTPFIALFKPVSPIVWLPLALIIVGGFIPDPDKHWFIQWLAGLPLLGWMKINPAFLASAITVALCSLWATMVNTALGVASIDKDHLNVARVLRLGFWDRLVKIVVPSALPLMFAGLRISLGVGWMVLIAAELLSSSEGIGKFVWDQFNNGASDSFAKMIVVVFVVGAIGLALDRIMVVLQRLVSFEGSVATV
ncbi:MAG: ABC transporter permease subunit [Pirellulales bacterium]|nr:ABC transporter permease subunit [Pirellulales bacterium]